LTPDYTIGNGPQKKAKSQTWLWVEVAFVYNPPGSNRPGQVAQTLPELTLNYYILLSNSGQGNPSGTLLVGAVTHTGITAGTDVHHSVMLVSPQTLKALFGGKAPASIQSATKAIGVTATVQGQLVAEESIGLGKGKKQWWQSLQQGPPGLVLSKDQTPFAPLFYDYFAAIKAKGAGY
jgi:hypothetical protein